MDCVERESNGALRAIEKRGGEGTSCGQRRVTETTRDGQVAHSNVQRPTDGSGTRHDVGASVG